MNTTQSSASVDTQAKPVPVILAAAEQQALWPLSTRSEPFVFRPDETGVSPVKRLLFALSERDDYASPVIFASEQAAQAAHEQIEGTSVRTRLVLVPGGGNEGAMAMLAALMAQHGHQVPLVFIAANVCCADLSALLEKAALCATRGAAALTSAAIVRPVREPGVKEGVDFFEVTGRNVTSSLQTGKVSSNARDESAHPMLIEMSALVQAAGITIGYSDAIVDIAGEKYPNALEACRRALEMAEHDGNRIRFRQEFLALARAIPLIDAMTDRSGAILLRQADEGVKLITSLADAPHSPVGFKISEELAGAPLVVEGYGDHRLFASRDGVLLVKTGQEKLARAHFGKQAGCLRRSAERNSVRHWWGMRETLCERTAVEMSVLTINAGCATGRAVHANRTASYSVISGQGNIVRDGLSASIGPGSQLLVAKDVVYLLANNSHEDLLVAETLSGLECDGATAPPIPVKFTA